MDTRLALRLNTAFSFATGGLLATAPATVGGWLGVSIDMWLRMLGVGLLCHGILLVWVASQRDVASWTKINLVLITPYPVLMIVLVATGQIDRQLGQVLALADGAVVGVCALGQWAGLQSSTTKPQPQGA